MRWGVGAFVIIGTLLTLVPVTSGIATPPFTATPSYATYGGLPIVGTSSVISTGTGSNSIGTPPSFTVATGSEMQAELSKSSGTGKHAIEVYSGVQNISFVCSGTNCANGTYYTSVEWNASWYSRVYTNCPGNSSGATLYSSVALGVLASVIDETTSPASVAGTLTLTLFTHSLYAAGSVTGAKISHLYLLKFKTALVKGDSYAIVTYFEAYAFTMAASPASAPCYSAAVERIGVLSHHTVLEWIKVS